jgi:hypothetical protein
MASLKLKMLEKSSSSWNYWYGKLLEHVQIHGHARTSRPRNRKALGTSEAVLASWVGTQRSTYATGQLSKSRIALLEQIPTWIWSVHDDQWIVAIEALQSFIKREGHALVPQKHVEEDFNLGLWASNLRARKHLLSLDRIDFLNSIEGWSWNPLDDQWFERFKELQDLSLLNGSSRIPRAFGGSLGTWVESQRSSKNRGVLTHEKIVLLESLPKWSWHTKKEAWVEGYEFLLEYVKEFGNCKVHPSYRVENYKLGAWVQKQRSRIHEYPEERRRLLETLPGWTDDLLEERWYLSYKALLDYVSREGNPDVPTDFIESGISLGNWVRTQRITFKQGKLDRARQEKLEQVTGWKWNPQTDNWLSGFNALLDYSIHSGSSNPPKPTIHNGIDIYSFARIQRSKRKRLSEDRKTKLESLPGWSWLLHDAAWEDGFEILMQYVSEHGTADVPQSKTYSKFKLGGWIATQRSRYKKGIITEAQIKRLESLNGWMWTASETKKKDYFHRGIIALDSYSKRTHSSSVPREHVEDGFPLGKWVTNLRSRYKDGYLSADEIEKIEATANWKWNSLDDAWEIQYKLAVAYCENNATSIILGTTSARLQLSSLNDHC